MKEVEGRESKGPMLWNPQPQQQHRTFHTMSLPVSHPQLPPPNTWVGCVCAAAHVTHNHHKQEVQTNTGRWEGVWCVGVGGVVGRW